MKITKEMLDMKISEFEDCISKTMTYREWIKEYETFYGLEHKYLDSMTSEELNNYDDFLFELTLK